MKQKGEKVVHAWAFLGAWDATTEIVCNSFKIEWPPRSGKFQEYPEQDKAAWMKYDEAMRHINPAQIAFLERAKEVLMPGKR